MASWLKIDFHTHSAEDPYDVISYDARRLISTASQKGFDALALTNHDILTADGKLLDFAASKGLLLLPGMEAKFSDKHVLIINPGFKRNPKKRSIKDLKVVKNEDNLIIAPHPFFPGASSLGQDLLDNITLFDAIEFSQYYTWFIDFNKKAIRTALRYQLPLVGSSDSHCIWQFGQSYSLVKAEKNIISIIKAVKEGKIKYHSPPLSYYDFCRSGILFVRTRCIKSRKRGKNQKTG